MTDLKMDVVGAAHEAMVEDETVRQVLLVEDGTDASLVGYDEAYRQVVVADADHRGLSVGDVVDCSITGHNTVYAFGEPV